MNPFRASHKTQGIRPQNPYLMKQTAGVCLQNTYDYSPFGVSLDGRTMEGDFYRYKYNGKELQEELGLNMYDYGARNYDPAIGRWMNVDPKAEQSRRWTPYNYAYNNPLVFVDPDGMQAYDWIAVFIAKNTYRPEWRDNVTSVNDKDIGKGNIYIGKSGEISCTDGKTYELNANGKASIAEPSVAKTSKEDPKPVSVETTDSQAQNVESTYDKVMDVSSGVGLGNDVKSVILAAAGVADDLGKYSTALKVIGGSTGILSIADGGSKLINSLLNGETPKWEDALNLASGVIGLGTSVAKAGMISNPVGIGIGFAQIAWGIYSSTQQPENK